MLLRDLVERPDNRPLEQAPHALYGVSMNIAPHILHEIVVDRLMDGVSISNPSVRWQIVRVDSFHALVGGGLQGSRGWEKILYLCEDCARVLAFKLLGHFIAESTGGQG